MKWDSLPPSVRIFVVILVLSWDDIAYTEFPPQPMNTEFAIGKLAGFFSHIVRIWALQKCCFWIHPSQWEPTKPTATTHILIQLLPPFYLTPWPDLRQGGHSLCCVKLWCGQGERWACGVSLCHTHFRCWAVGIGGNCRLLGFPGDSWGVLELELGTFSRVVRASGGSGSSVCTWLCSRSVFNWLFAVSRAAWFWEELCPSTPQPERVSCKLHLNT